MGSSHRDDKIVLHAKTLIVDDEWANVVSTKFDRRRLDLKRTARQRQAMNIDAARRCEPSSSPRLSTDHTTTRRRLSVHTPVSSRRFPRAQALTLVVVNQTGSRVAVGEHWGWVLKFVAERADDETL